MPRPRTYGLWWQTGARKAVLAADNYNQIQWWILWILPNQNVNMMRQNSGVKGLSMNVKNDNDDGGTMWCYTRCENSGKWASPQAFKEVQISGSIDYRQW